MVLILLHEQIRLIPISVLLQKRNLSKLQAGVELDIPWTGLASTLRSVFLF